MLEIDKEYWNKLQAGKKVAQRPLPPRSLGMHNIVTIGSSYWNSHPSNEDIMNGPDPVVPAFATSPEEVRIQAADLLKQAKFPLHSKHFHPAISKIIGQAQQYAARRTEFPYSFHSDRPDFESAFERRRLKFLNALFLGLAQCNVSCSIHGKLAREIYIGVGNTNITVTLESVKAKQQLERERSGYSFTARGEKDGMGFEIGRHFSDDEAQSKWVDSDDHKIESHLQEIALEIIVSGEMQYRASEFHSYEWRTKRKAKLIEEERQRQIESERQRLEKLRKAEQRRIGHLLRQAENYHRAQKIRAYVDEVKDAVKEKADTSELETWAKWALDQADQLDPVLQSTYKEFVDQVEEN